MSTAASTAFKRSALVLTGSTAAWIAYDYQTQHPMRKMAGAYHFGAAAIRFHNLAVRQIPFLTTKLTIQQLQQHNGDTLPTVYFSAGGYVYDVTESDMFRQAYGQWKGKDATVALAKMSLSESDVNNFKDWKRLEAADQESLDSWTRYFREKYWIRARLTEYWETD